MKNQDAKLKYMWEPVKGRNPVFKSDSFRASSCESPPGHRGVFVLLIPAFMLLIIPFLLFLTIVFLRALPRLLINKGKLWLDTSDTWYHLMLSEEIRQNGHKLPKRISGFLLSDGITYPHLFHTMLSYVSKRQRAALEPFLGGILDGVLGACLFYGSHMLLGLDMRASLFVAILFVFCPHALGLSFGPRATYGTPRVFGQLLFFLNLLMLVLYLITNAPFYGLAAIGLGSLIFIASMFSSQAYIFILVIWSLLLLSIDPLVVLLCSYLVAIIVSRGHVWRISVGHVLHLRVMAKTFWKGIFLAQHIQQRNRLSDLLRLPRLLFTDLKQVFFLFYVRNTFLIVMFQIPVATFYVYARFHYGPVLNGLPLIHILDTLIISGLVVFAAVSSRPLMFLGEAERYVEHVAPFCCIFIGVTFALTGVWSEVYGVLLYSIVLYMTNTAITVFQSKTRNSIVRQRDTQSVLNWINAEAPQKRFVVLPQTGLNVLIAYLTSGSVLFGRWKDDCSPALKSLKDVESDEFRRYRPGLLETYDIDYIIIPGTSPVHRNLAVLREEFQVVFSNSCYCILLCRQAIGSG